MPYNNNIPQPTDILSDSQDDLLNNFMQLSTAWNINHIPYNAVNQGFHSQVTLPVAGAVITPTIPGVANIYSDISPLTGDVELSWQRQNNGARIEWTGAFDGPVGWTRLPSGILLKWGIFDTPTGVNDLVTFPTAVTIPIFDNVFTVLVSCTSPAGLFRVANVVDGSLNTLGFNTNTWSTSNSLSIPATIYYLVIGI